MPFLNNHHMAHTLPIGKGLLHAFSVDEEIRMDCHHAGAGADLELFNLKSQFFKQKAPDSIPVKGTETGSGRAGPPQCMV